MNFRSYLETDFSNIALSQTGHRCLIIHCPKEKNKDVHASQISRGLLVNRADLIAIARRKEFRLPELFLWLGKEGGWIHCEHWLHMCLSSQSHSGCSVMFWGWFSSFWWYVMQIHWYTSDTHLPSVFIKELVIISSHIFQLEHRLLLVKLASVFSFCDQHDY